MISEFRWVAAFEVIDHALKEYGELLVTAAVEIAIRHMPYLPKNTAKYGSVQSAAVTCGSV